MAVPQYPSILTEADWNKNKSLKAKVTANDPIGKQLNVLAALHRAVVWGSFDLTKGLAGGKPTSKNYQQALDGAKAEYTRTVRPLLGRLKLLEDELKKQVDKTKNEYFKKMAVAAKTYGEQVEAVQASYEAFEKARDEAKAKEPKKESAGLDLESETDLLNSLSGPGEKVLLKEVIGPKFFADLERIAFYRDMDVLQWTENPALGLDPRTNTPNNLLSDIQTRGKAFIVGFQQVAGRLKDLGNRSAPRELGLRAFKQTWLQARRMFNSPGFFQGTYQFWIDKQLEIGSGPAAVEQWRRANPDAYNLHRKVGDLLNADRMLFDQMDQHIVRLRGKAAPKEG